MVESRKRHTAVLRGRRLAGSVVDHGGQRTRLAAGVLTIHYQCGVFERCEQQAPEKSGRPNFKSEIEASCGNGRCGNSPWPRQTLGQFVSM
jgi:hypothetical protein